jgi:triacylglycerol lipase
MVKGIMLTVFIVLFSLPVAVSAGTSCATKYPVVLAHGMGTESEVMGLIDYWGDIPSALQNEGASVYITNVNGMDAKANKAAAFKTQVLQILAVTGKAKVNVIGHSDGCLYTRYAISNLGLGSKVQSHTSIAGPHRGSYIADMIMGLLDATGLTSLAGTALDWVWSFVMGDVDPDTKSQGYELTRNFMINTFNPNVPNVSDVYYQSWAYRVTSAIGAGLLTITWLAMLPVEGDNDVLVSVTSAKWGNFRGVIDGGILGQIFGGGVSHLAAVGLLTAFSIGYDPADHFVSVVKELKTKGY